MTHSMAVFLLRLRERFDELARARGYAGVHISEVSFADGSYQVDADLPDGKTRYAQNVDRREIQRCLDEAEPAGRVGALEMLLRPIDEITKQAAERLARRLADDLPDPKAAPP